MENIIKLAEPKEFFVNDLIKTSKNSAQLHLSSQDAKTVRDIPVSYDILIQLLKKNGWLKRKWFRKKFNSVYRVEQFPYYDKGWKRFYWRESIDGKIFHQNNEFPDSLKNFVQNYNNIEYRFKQELTRCFDEEKQRCAGSLTPVLDVFWAKFLVKYSDKMDILHKLYPLLVRVGKDTHNPRCIVTPLNIRKFLSYSQKFEDIPYAKLAEAYKKIIYKYLRFCFYEDVAFIEEIYGKDDILGKSISITEYEDYLLLISAVDKVVAYLE